MNPFTVLHVQRGASKKEIITAMALALRERNYSAKDIAEAQKDLLNPVSRKAHSILQFADIEPLFSKIDVGIKAIEKTEEIKPLSLFDEK